MRYIFYIASLSLTVPACQQTVKKPSPQPTFINECFVRSGAEREKLMAQASQGDADACMELSNYYSFIELDDNRAIYWLKKAVALDPSNKVWKHNLKVMTTGEDTDE